MEFTPSEWKRFAVLLYAAESSNNRVPSSWNLHIVLKGDSNYVTFCLVQQKSRHKTMNKKSSSEPFQLVVIALSCIYEHYQLIQNSLRYFRFSTYILVHTQNKIWSKLEENCNNGTDQSLTSTSTPAGRSSCIKESIVWAVGYKMSMRRWWVRISKWNLASLCTCGDLRTQ